MIRAGRLLHALVLGHDRMELACNHVVHNACEFVCDSGDLFGRAEAGLHSAEVVAQEGLASVQGLRG